MLTVQAKVKYLSQRERRAEEEAKKSNILAVRDLYGTAHQLQQLQVILQANDLKKQEDNVLEGGAEPTGYEGGEAVPNGPGIPGMGLEE